VYVDCFPWIFAKPVVEDLHHLNAGSVAFGTKTYVHIKKGSGVGRKKGMDRSNLSFSRLELVIITRI
jgi:hypothetical protein